MLRVPSCSVMNPQSVEGAVAALNSFESARVLGGGTDLLAALKHGHGAPDGRPLSLVSLRGLGLSSIRERGSAVVLGAATTLWDILRWAPGGALDIVGKAARSIAAPPIQSRATLGGNLCLDTRCFHYNQSTFWRSSRPACFKAGGGVCHVAPGVKRCFACHQADLPPVLIALGAEIEVVGSNGSRRASLESLYSGDGKDPLTLSSGELVTSVFLPVPPRGAGAGWEKIRMRKGLDFGLASASAYLEKGPDGRCTMARVVLGAVGSGPIRVTEAEEALVGSLVDETALERVGAAAQKAARPVKNCDLTPAWRKQVAGAAAKRAVEQAHQGRTT